MNRLSVTLMVIALICSFVPLVTAADDITEHKACNVCGMDIDQGGRVLIEYENGGKVDVCSINCAAKELESASRDPKAVWVADYNTGALIDAGKAAWVKGGSKQGIMTQKAKWAFADKSAALAFIDRNGGELAEFDQIMTAANEENGESACRSMGDHACHHMVPGSQMLYNPAFGDDIYHTHPAGTWMVNYKFMYTDMEGLRHDTTDVPVTSVGPMKQYPYMMIPTSMSMYMNMMMVMYGVTDELTAMVTANYQANEMDMLMDMGMGAGTGAPMNTSGFGDTELRAIYKINQYLNGSLGLTIPTGSIEKNIDVMGMELRAPYDMQPGGGTFNLRPALTYSQLSSDALWNWGAQAMYTWHISENYNDWACGDNFKLTWWLQRALGPVTAWLRMAYNETGEIRGQDTRIEKLLDMTGGMPTPDADPRNYGGQQVDFFLGTSFTKGRFSFGIEGGIPVYENLNGLQLKTDWMLTVGGQLMF